MRVWDLVEPSKPALLVVTECAREWTCNSGYINSEGAHESSKLVAPWALQSRGLVFHNHWLLDLVLPTKT